MEIVKIKIVSLETMILLQRDNNFIVNRHEGGISKNSMMIINVMTVKNNNKACSERDNKMLSSINKWRKD